MHAAAAKQPLTYFTITTQRGWNYGYQDTRTVHTTIQVGQERVAMMYIVVLLVLVQTSFQKQVLLFTKSKKS